LAKKADFPECYFRLLYLKTCGNFGKISNFVVLWCAQHRHSPPGSDSYIAKQNSQLTLHISVIFISHVCCILGSHSSFSVIQLDTTNHCHGSLYLGQKKIQVINYNRPPCYSCYRIRLTRGKSPKLSMMLHNQLVPNNDPQFAKQ
jgi:hypothetical protein